MKNETRSTPVDFKQAVIATIEKETMDREHLDALIEALGKSQTPDFQAEPNKFFSRGAATSRRTWLAGAVLLAVGLLASQYFDLRLENKAHLIAAEVARNHIKLKPLDVASSSFTDVQTYFDQLDFALIPSRLKHIDPVLADNRLIGGRYCSIQGVTAAQLRYRTNGGAAARSSTMTLYQAAYEPELHGDLPISEQGDIPVYVAEKGLDIYLWVERGILVVLVSEV